MAEAIAISAMVRNGSSRSLSTAFQAAWQAAASSTAAKTKGSMLSLHARIGRIVWRFQAGFDGHPVTGDIEFEAGGQEFRVHGRAAGRDIAERDDSAKRMAVRRGGHLARGFAVAQDQLAAMRERGVGGGADEAQE